MPYATQQDMLDRFGAPRLVQLTDIGEPLAGVVNAVVLERALADASAEIDGYLVGRVALPLAVPPEILRVYCCTLALYRLAGPAADEVLREDVKTIAAYLRRVASGEISITAAADAPAPAGIGSVLFAPGQKVMGRDPGGVDFSDGL